AAGHPRLSVGGATWWNLTKGPAVQAVERGRPGLVPPTRAGVRPWSLTLVRLLTALFMLGSVLLIGALLGRGAATAQALVRDPGTSGGEAVPDTMQSPTPAAWLMITADGTAGRDAPDPGRP